MWRFLSVVIAFALAPAQAVPTVDVVGLARAAAKPVEDAVIWLDAPAGLEATPPAEGTLRQRDMQFFPHVLAVRVGTRVKFPNQDRVFHNVFSFHDSRKFDLGLYPAGAVKDVPFDRPGLSRVFCNIHPQMAAYVMVLDTPYFAVSDRQGRFTIPQVPVGPVRYHAWRPGGGILNGELTVTDDNPQVIAWP